MVRHSTVTLLILAFNHLLDTGRYDDISLEEVKEHIEDGSILRYIKKRAGQDFWVHYEGSTGEAFERFYVTYLQSLLHTYGGDERRKWGIENRGLCLLIAWTNEILQQGSGWEPHKDIAGVEYP